MSVKSYWQGWKRRFLTDENAQRKWEQLLPNEDFSILDEFHPRTKLQILHWLSWQENQDLDALHHIIEMARADYRDIGISEMRHEWELSEEATAEQIQVAREKDGKQYTDWLSS